VLGEWITQNGYKDIKIWGALLMVGDAKIASLENPAIYIITKLDRLKTYIDNLPDNEAYKSDLYHGLTSLFEKRNSL